MDLETKARANPYCLATRLEECPFDWCWIISLGEGVSVYQTEDDITLQEPNSWMRLKLFCEKEQVKIQSMDYICRSNPGANLHVGTHTNGYFFAKRARRMMMASDLSYMGYEDYSIGIGALHGFDLNIMWRFNDGKLIHELRDIRQHQPITLITV